VLCHVIDATQARIDALAVGEEEAEAVLDIAA
jgi:hypothetical protein